MSDYLSLDSKLFSDNGIHNGFILSDSDYYVDPEKLSQCKIPEFENSLDIIYERMNSVLTLLKILNQKVTMTGMVLTICLHLKNQNLWL